MSASGKILIAIEAVNRTRQDFAEFENGIERLRKARLASSRITLEEARTVRYLRQVYRAQHQGYYDTINIMRNVGYIGSSILRMWQAHNIAQMRVKESLDSVEEAQQNVNTTLELYGENSVIYQDAVDRLEEVKEAAERAKGDQTTGMIGFGLAAVGVAAQVGTLIAKLGELGMLATAGTAGLAMAGGIATAGGLAALTIAGGPTAPTPMSELAGPGAMTLAEMMAGMTYEEKFGQWRQEQMGGIQIFQAITGVPEDVIDDAVERLRDEIARLIFR